MAFAWLGLLAFGATALAATARIKDVRLWSGPEGTRLVIETSAAVEYDVFPLDNPARIVIDLANADLADEKLPAGQGPVRQVRSGPQARGGLRFVLDLESPQQPRSFTVGPEGDAGHRLVVELPGTGTLAARSAPATTAPSGNEVLSMASQATSAIASSPAPVALPPPSSAPVVASSSGGTAAAVPAAAKPRVSDPPALPAQKSIATAAAKGRDLVIAIDAGHGGQDPGAIGRGGTREKDVTLAIARKLAAAINAEEGMRAVLIREGDYFLSLASRTRKARQLGADMFVSVHADSVLNREVSGSSVYVLSLRGASDEAAKWLAESENAADLKGGVPLAEDDLLASVLLDVTQKEAISDSVEAAESVLASLRRVGSVHRPRVQHAGFVVLKSPDIPSMLVETAFISNAGDERRLRDADHQARIAQAIREGVRDYWYENPPPGTRLAAIVAARRAAAGPTVASK
jgi:N-acetylmuramoyl-L-alanine amidase